MLTLVLGGVRSGKSQLAERLALQSGAPVIYLATYLQSPEGDPEMAARVARHRERRPRTWRTVEAPDPLAAFGDDLSGAGEATLLVDNLTGWLVAMMAADQPVLAPVERFAAAAAARAAQTIVVADETGLGGIASHAVSRRFADVSGEACQLLTAAAAEAWLVIAGQPLALKGAPRPAQLPSLRPLTAPAHADSAPAATDRAAFDLGPLRVHGDTEARPGELDFAVSVLPGEPPPAIAKVLAASLEQVDRYPDDGPATRALADRHSRKPEEVLVVNGAAEAFWLLAGLASGFATGHVPSTGHAPSTGLGPAAGNAPASTYAFRRAVCVHPSFTEAELALRTRGIPVSRVLRDPVHFGLLPENIDPAADLVVTANPNNPTGTLDPGATLADLAQADRLLVIDEAFMDLVPGQAESLSGRGDLPGVMVVRSLTKVLGVPGLRVGYVIGPADLVAALRAARQPWSVSTPALAVLEAYATGEVDTELLATSVARERTRLAAALGRLPGVVVWPSAANFLLLRVPCGPAIREALHRRGIAVRPGDTFPGLTPDHLRVAVRTAAEDDRLIEALRAALAEVVPGPGGRAREGR